MPFFLVIAKKDPSAYKEYSIIPNATSVFQKICSMSYGTPDIAIIGIWLDGVNEIAGCSTSPTSSPAPTTETKEIQWVGDPCNSVFPQTGKCAECTGDCDHDSDCEDGLVCYQRNIGDVNVPGCTWGSNNALLINHPGDYCVNAISTSTPAPVASPTTYWECSDSTLRIRTLNGKGDAAWRGCAWVSHKPYRCLDEGHASHCPETCNLCDTCEDSTLRFKLVKDDGTMIARDCGWVKNKQTEIRCGYTGVAETCPRTCGLCV